MLGSPGRSVPKPEVGIRNDDAERVRPDNAHVFKPAGDLDDLLFQLSALRTGLSETTGEDNQAQDTGLAALLNEPGDFPRRRADHRQVRNLRKAGEIRVRGNAADRFDAETDGINDAAESGAEKVRQHPPAEVPRGLPDADQGHPSRFENLLKVANAHDRLSVPVCPPATGRIDGSPDIR